METDVDATGLLDGAGHRNGRDECRGKLLSLSSERIRHNMPLAGNKYLPVEFAI